ncbi:MAG: WD40/YVTN/BNR-like repeat-containing protein [Planctomycetaceae bacterium]
MPAFRRLLPLVLAVLMAPAAADVAHAQRMKAATFAGIKLRNVGPALMSGRIADVAIDPVKPNTWYVAAGSGNLWKTANAGTTWKPIFENYGSYSIGCVAIDPRNRNVVWVGTGEAVGGRHVGYGDGVYLSRDGGQSFTNMGLKKSEHIAKILVDPRNSNVVYVASQGPLWSAGGERGLYKSTNGGKTWTSILSKGKYTGVTDIAFDPRNPDIVFAVTHQRHRTVAALINGGPESGIWKSVDAGKTWRELKRGLPGGDKGKISIALSPQKPDVMYATIELAGRTGGFWRSTNAGESWTKMSDYISGGTGPHYYQELWADPHRFDVLYQANVRLGRTEDGGKTWTSVGNSNKHVDNHAVGFHPTDEDFVLVGCDGGLYRSYDYAKTWHFTANLPLTQFYKVDVDYDKPFYHIVGGTQDNSTQYGPSRALNNSGIRNSDWRLIIGGDGHDCAIDPKDPNIIYGESQQGYIQRIDRRTWETIRIRPTPARGQDALRYNWDSPILISPHSNKRIYHAAERLYQSDDRGESWKAISPDLSRKLDRFKLPLMGRVWSIDHFWDLLAMSQFGNITSISESYVKEGLIYVGTDDGLIHVTENGGKTWRQCTPILGVPRFAFVNDVKADRFDPNTVYAVFDHHKTGDFKPYLMKSTNRGKTWTSIAGNLPARHIVWRFEQDHVKKDLFFAGTEFGIFFSVDGGKTWIKLSGAPNIPFRDLAIQKRENDLVGASFGRSFFVLDDYSPLRMVDDKVLSRPFTLFPIKDALLYVPARPLGGRQGSQGDAFFVANNPPYGAVFTYHLRDSLTTLKQQRHKKEAANKAKNAGNPYPGWARLKQEEREDGPALVFTITDDTGNIVNRVTGTATAGIHRVAWNLRYTGFTAGSRFGPFVVPGVYTVKVHKRVNDKITPLGKPQTVKVVSLGESTLPRQDRKATLAFQKQVGALQKVVVAANGN